MEESTDHTETRDPYRVRARNFGADLRTALLGRWYWVAGVTFLTLAAAGYYLSVAPSVYQSMATVQVKVSTPGLTGPKDEGPQSTDLDLRTADAINTIVGKFKMVSLYEAMLAENPALMEDPALLPAPLRWTPHWLRGKETGAAASLPAPADSLGPPAPATRAGPPKSPAMVASDPGHAAPVTGGAVTPAIDPAVLDKQEAVRQRAAQLAPELSGWFNVASRRQTRLVDITVLHTNAHMAQRLADAVVSTYEKVYVENRSGRSGNSLEMVTKLSEKAREDLQEANKALAAYRTALALNEKLKEQETALATLLLRYRNRHPNVIESRKLLQDTQESFLREFAAVRESGADRAYWKSTGITGTAKRQTGDPAATDDVANIDANTGPDAPGAAEFSATATAKRDRAVEEAVRQLQARSKVLESEIESKNRIFTTLLTSMQNLNLTRTEENKEAEVIPLEPAREGVLSAPKPPLIYAAAGLGGLILGVALTLLLHRLDNRIHTVTDLEQVTAAPVLASVAALRPDVLVRSEAPPGTDALMQAWAPDIFFRDNGAKTIEAEMIRILRTSLILLGPQEAFRTILFTSALPGEGKSFISANVAVSFAMQGARTLLVDMDLRRPRQHALFGTDRHKGAGLVDVLAGQCGLPAAIHPAGLANLFLLTAGSHAPNPAEILNVERLKQLLDALKGGFDRIIIDTAPLLPVSDTRLISRVVDTCILVVGAEKIPKGAILRAFELLGERSDGHGSARIGGCVLNGTVESRRNLGYNYSYGYYGKYGNKYSSYGTVYGDDAEDEGKEKSKRTKSEKV